MRVFKRSNYFHDIFHFSFEITNVMVSNPEIIFLIPPSIVDVSPVNPNDMNTLLSRGVSIFS